MSDWPLPRKHLSASAIGTFAKCPEQFRLGYVLDQWGPSAGVTVLGNGVHGGLEWALNRRLLDERLPPINAARDAYHAAFEREAESSEVDWGESTRGAEEQRGRELFDAYYEEVAPSLVPISLEHHFDIRVAGVPVPITGKIDIITATAKIDVKTGKQAPKQPRPDWMIAALVYLLVDERPFHWHTMARLKDGPTIRTPATEPGLVVERTALAVAQASRVVRSYSRAILSLMETHGPDEPWPGAITHQYACGYCSHRDNDECVYWRDPATEWSL